MKCFYCTTSQRHSAICCHLSACNDLSALKCPTRQIQILMGSRMLLQELIKFLNCQHYSQDINKFTYLLLLVCSIDLEVAGSVFERVFIL